MKNFKEGGFGHGGGGFGGRQKFSRGGDRVGNGRGKFGGGKAGGGKFGGGQDRGSRPFDKPELFSATCSTCGKACEVPFRPSPDKPVYCSACFGKNALKEGREERGERGGRDDRRAGSDFKKEARGQREERTFKQDFAPIHKDNGHDELKKQILALESKVNRVLELLGTQKEEKTKAQVAVTPPKEEVKKIRKPKTVKSPAALKKDKVKKAAKVVKAVKKAAKAKK